jgi:hypothetical protein
LLLQQHEGLAEALTTATGEDNQGVGWMGGIGCGVDQDSRGDSPQPAEHDDHKPKAKDPAARRPSAAAPDLARGCLPSGIAQQPRRSQPRPPPPGFGGHKIHHEPFDRDHNGPRGGIVPGSPASARSIPRHCTIRPPAEWPRQQRGEEPGSFRVPPLRQRVAVHRIPHPYSPQSLVTSCQEIPTSSYHS